MSKPDKKSPGQTAAEPAHEAASEATPETPNEPASEATPETPNEPAGIEAAASIVPHVPTSALTQKALTQQSDLGSRIAQFEGGLADLEERINALADKYPEYAPGLLDMLMRYGMSSTDDALDVSVRAPATYIRLRHGMSKNVPKELKVDIGEFFTAERNLGASFEALIIYAHDSRKYFIGSDLGSPDCQSHDAKFGSKYGECALCPYAPFDEAANKSQCSKGYAMMIATPDFSLIGEVSFMRTATAEGRRVLRRLKTLKGGLSQWVTEINTVEHTSGKHTNAVPTGGLPKTATTPEQREVLETLTKFFKLRAMTFAARGEQRRAQRGLGGGGSATAGALGGGGGSSAASDESDVPLI